MCTYFIKKISYDYLFKTETHKVPENHFKRSNLPHLHRRTTVYHDRKSVSLCIAVLVASLPFLSSHRGRKERGKERRGRGRRKNKENKRRKEELGRREDSGRKGKCSRNIAGNFPRVIQKRKVEFWLAKFAQI